MTRYPKAGRGHKWTIRELAAIPTDWKGDTISDGGGLSGEVRVADGAASVRFKYAFRWDGKVKWYQCGTWPAVDLAEIRARRDAARDLVGQGVNPNDHKQADRIERQKAVEATIEAERIEREQNLSVAALVDSWILNGTAQKDGGAGMRRKFDKDVIPAIGDKPVRDVTADDLRGLLRGMVQERGVNRSAIMLLRDLQQMFRWAGDEQPWRRLLIEGDPSKRIRPETIVDTDYDLNNERNRTLSPDEIRELAAIYQRMDATYEGAADKRTAARPLQPETRIALWLALATCCRIGEILKAEWQHVDLDAGRWIIPRENYKRQRSDKRGDYLVLLSPFARRQFEALRAITGDSQWCFPAKHNLGPVCDKSVSKQVGDRQVRFKARSTLKNRRNDNTLVLAGGANGEWTPHDLRRTGSTLMQRLGVSNDVRNLCLNHSIGSKIDRTYGVYDFVEEKRDAWERLGAEIEAILG
ncbi:Site-specific integrase OS=Castellaniella sp OX=1955812 GN=EPN31_04870 PE=4 SV=1 [Castellaniella denitrificans]